MLLFVYSGLTYRVIVSTLTAVRETHYLFHWRSVGESGCTMPKVVPRSDQVVRLKDVRVCYRRSNREEDIFSLDIPMHNALIMLAGKKEHSKGEGNGYLQVTHVQKSMIKCLRVQLMDGVLKDLQHKFSQARHAQGVESLKTRLLKPHGHDVLCS